MIDNRKILDTRATAVARDRRTYEKRKHNNDDVRVSARSCRYGFRLYLSDLRESEKIPLFYSGSIFFFFFFLYDKFARVFTVVTAAAVAVLSSVRLMPSPTHAFYHKYLFIKSHKNRVAYGVEEWWSWYYSVIIIYSERGSV